MALPHRSWRDPSLPDDMRRSVVYALCAQWCGTCREFRAAWDATAAAHPDCEFVWIDVEDEAERVEDFEVETFPTIAVIRDGTPLFFGPIVPARAAVERLLHADVHPQRIRPEDRRRLERLHAGLGGV